MSRTLRIFAPAITLLLLAGIAALITGLSITGAAQERQLLDPGVIIRYLGPLSRMLVNISLAVMLGSLTFALWALSPQKKEWPKILDLAAAAAGILTVSGIISLIVTFIEVSNQSFSASDQFGAALAQFITEFELGRLWLILIVSAAITTVMCFAVRSRKMLLLPFVTAAITILPLAAQGHAAGASGHSLAVNSMFLHITGAAVWLGGLFALIAVSLYAQASRLAQLASRYSTLALVAAIAVAISGVVSGATRLTAPADLFVTGYGRLLLLKTATLILLLCFGAIHRLKAIAQLKQKPEHKVAFFVRLLISEIAVMGIASGLAAALGRSETPQAIVPASELEQGISPAEYLTGDPLPPELTASSAFTVWKFDLLWAAVAIGAIVFYLYGVQRLRQRGDKWHLGRTLSWIAGMLLLGYVTNGFLNAYEAYMFSMHMLGHMFLTMLIPMLLVLGAPVTLILRVSAKRKDGSWGAREWALWLVNTPYSKFLTNPIVAATIFAGSLWVFYFTPILDWSMRTHLGHQWMIVHFLLSGYLFVLALIGVDPVPHRVIYPLRIIILFAAMAAHAFFGVTIMSSESLLAADWFGAMGRTWGEDPLTDQQSGGGIAWGIGELPTLLIMLVLSVQWARSDEKEQKRKDRAAERSDEAELRAYNQMLADRARATTSKTGASKTGH